MKPRFSSYSGGNLLFIAFQCLTNLSPHSLPAVGPVSLQGADPGAHRGGVGVPAAPASTLTAAVVMAAPCEALPPVHF